LKQPTSDNRPAIKSNFMGALYRESPT
jgi:hypothetical protein